MGCELYNLLLAPAPVPSMQQELNKCPMNECMNPRGQLHLQHLAPLADTWWPTPTDGHLSLGQPTSWAPRSPDAQLQGPTSAGGFLEQCFLTAQVMAGSHPEHASYSSFPIRGAVHSKHLLDIRHSSNCFCKALTPLGFMTTLRSWAHNCSHFTDRETEAWGVPIVGNRSPHRSHPQNASSVPECAP